MRWLVPAVLPLALRSMHPNIMGMIQWDHSVSPAGRMRATP